MKNGCLNKLGFHDEYKQYTTTYQLHHLLCSGGRRETPAAIPGELIEFSWDSDLFLIEQNATMVKMMDLLN